MCIWQQRPPGGIAQSIGSLDMRGCWLDSGRYSMHCKAVHPSQVAPHCFLDGTTVDYRTCRGCIDVLASERQRRGRGRWHSSGWHVQIQECDSRLQWRMEKRKTKKVKIQTCIRSGTAIASMALMMLHSRWVSTMGIRVGVAGPGDYFRCWLVSGAMKQRRCRYVWRDCVHLWLSVGMSSLTPGLTMAELTGCMQTPREQRAREQRMKSGRDLDCSGSQ